MVFLSKTARWAILVLLAIASFASGARADTDDVTVLTPPPIPPPGATVPVIEKPPIESFYGRTIAATEILLEDTRWPDVRPPILTAMRGGERLSAGLVRAALAELLTGGAFADARASATPEDGGVRITFHLMPRKVIDGIRIDLHGAAVDGDELLRDVDLAAEGELAADDVPRLESRLVMNLRRRGFPSPEVKITTQGTEDPRRDIVRVDVLVGAPLRIERRVLYPIRASRSDAADAERSYAARAGDRADESALSAADAALEGRIRGRGFHRAEVTHDVVLHRGIVTLRVRVDFKLRYETRYEGNDHYDQSTLDDALDLEDETDRNPSHLASKVHDFYVKHGFYDAEVKLETRGTERDAVSYLVFHVTEGARVQVASRAYACLRPGDIKKLSDAPSSDDDIGREIDSFLEEELPGADLLAPPDPKTLDATISSSGGTRPSPPQLDPDTVYVPDTYERALQHVQELFRASGYLAALVGPVQMQRRRCDPKSPVGTCRPLPLPRAPDACTYDAIGLPLPVAPLPEGSTCTPDPARGVACEPRMTLRIPVKLGPRTQLWDLAFVGVQALTPTTLAKVAELKLGGWLSTVQIEEARKRVADAYKEEGFAFVDVKYALDLAPDHTRARVRFLVTEGDKVIVQHIAVNGNNFTKSDTIMSRVALEIGQPYRASDVRKTEERIATLGTFASVDVALENPYVPQRNKTVVITVVERPRQYTDLGPGFSTGEGFRLAAEYGHRNLWGKAVQLTLRLQLAYIPTPFIIDPTARDNYRNLGFIARLGVRATGSVVFPEVGLGPLIQVGADGIVVHDLQRDFYLTKLAAIPNIRFWPIKEFQVSYFQSAEFNNSRIFNEASRVDYLKALQAQGINITDKVLQLNVPDGESYAVSERVLATWDRRDNAFNARRGIYLVTGIEHVDAFPTEAENAKHPDNPNPESHFFKLTQTFAGYIPLPKGLRIAALTRIGANIQLNPRSQTYPDRLFFLGGVDSMRGWTLNSFIPQDVVDLISDTRSQPDTIVDNTGKTVANPNKVTPNTDPIRGGNFMVNERVEIRIPIRGIVETVIFSDVGNIWRDPSYPFDRLAFPMRVDVGTGLRVQTPVGPLAIDYGFNVTREIYEDIGALNFAIGLF